MELRQPAFLKKALNATFITLGLWQRPHRSSNILFECLWSIQALSHGILQASKMSADVRSQEGSGGQRSAPSIIPIRLKWQPHHALHLPPLIDLQMPLRYWCHVTHSIKHGCRVNTTLFAAGLHWWALLALLTSANRDLLSRDSLVFPAHPVPAPLLLPPSFNDRVTLGLQIPEEHMRPGNSTLLFPFFRVYR